ncbi:MAG TPA: hypothetical protein VM578_08335 [Candidatus Saccharimonadales bacterium]|nr:hypothetical protein [Candidatus Saccharimonadales bacterium]
MIFHAEFLHCTADFTETSTATISAIGESYGKRENVCLPFGGFFLYNGINHFLQYKTLVGYAASKKVPMPPERKTGAQRIAA